MNELQPTTQSSAVETVFEIQQKQLALEQERQASRLDSAKNIVSLGTALAFSGTALYGIFSSTIDTTVVCALIGAATTLLTGIRASKKGKNNE